MQKRITTFSSREAPESDSDFNRICFFCAPDIVWELIFEALQDDSNALTNCSLASLKWSGMLSKTKTDFMIPLVLPIVAKRLRSFTCDELKTFRLVSRTWKKAVDDLNAFELDMPPRPYHRVLRRRRVSYWTIRQSLLFNGWTQIKIRNPAIEEETPPTARTALETIAMMNELRRRGSVTNPLPGRVLHFHTQFPMDLNPDLSYKYDHKFGIHPEFRLSVFRECLKLDKCFHEMLNSVGEHIWHLVFTIQLFIYRGHYGRNLIKMLFLVPNLRSLELRFESRYEVTEWVGPVPPLPNLVTLSLKNMHCDECIPKFLIASYGHQLETLECYSLGTNDLDMPITLPRLKTLKILCSIERYLHKLGSKLIAPLLARVFVRMESRESPNPLWDLIVGLENFAPSLELLHADELGSYAFQLLDPLLALPHQQQLALSIEAERGSGPLPQFPRLKILEIGNFFQFSPDKKWVLSKFPVLQNSSFWYLPM